jgi:hypothetical protein
MKCPITIEYGDFVAKDAVGTILEGIVVGLGDFSFVDESNDLPPARRIAGGGVTIFGLDGGAQAKQWLR